MKIEVLRVAECDKTGYFEVIFDAEKCTFLMKNDILLFS